MEIKTWHAVILERIVVQATRLPAGCDTSARVERISSSSTAAWETMTCAVP